MTAWLQCGLCDSRHEIGPMFHGCPACRASGRISPLEVRYGALPSTLQPGTDPGIWKWAEWLPPVDPGNRISLGESSTPLLPVQIEEVRARVFVKNETVNPTWSWKDRPNAVSMSMARQLRFRRAVAISTGNHGSSAAAYSSKAGIQCAVLCHQDAPDLQVALMHSYGAFVSRQGDREEAAQRLIDRGDVFPDTILCPRAGFANPYGVEGFKTIAFEIVQQLGIVPDRVFVPVGSGDGIYGVWKGFRELRDAGAVASAPRMIACQSAGADSLVRAVRAGERRIDVLERVRTSALSIAEPFTGYHALRAVSESGGDAVAVTDDALVESARYAARQGLGIELSSAATLAGMRYRTEHMQNETWVAIATGAAIKWPESLIARNSHPGESAEFSWSELR